MKTQISRTSFNKKKRYSGVYQQQGRMITDADWNEQADISKERVNAAMNDAVKSGSPREDGIIDLSVVPPVLKWGVVYADGIRARIAPDPSLYKGAPPDTIDYIKQKDFPSPPALPGNGDYTLYIDIWERPVISIEDTDLLDYGLHGADTCSRTQTMAQLKWCPLNVDPETDAQKNPSKGNALLSVVLKSETTEEDPCDPCANETDIETRTGNYLFRMEVHDVSGPAEKPTGITLKWSSENGAEAHIVGNEPPDFTEGKWIYEFFDPSGEKQMGVIFGLPDPNPVRGHLVESGYPANTDGLPAMVRRWDGVCTLNLEQGTAQGTYLGTAIKPAYDDGVLSVSLNAMDFSLTLSGKQVVTGDYWPAVVREQAPEGKKVDLISPTPVGIDHHYVKIASFSGGVMRPLTNLEKRKLCFPPLTDITADKVGYDPMVKQNRWKDIMETTDLGTPPAPNTVQDAMDTLVDNLESSDIRYDIPACGNEDQPSVRQLLGMAGGTTGKVSDVLQDLLCKLTADTLPLDLDHPDLASLLKNPNVKTVQDALNLLSRNVGGQVCAFTVDPGETPGESTALADAFKTFEDDDHIVFCLKPGTFSLPSTPVTGKKSIKIMGAGNTASIISVARKFSWSADEVIFRDVAFVGKNAGAALDITAGRVSSDGCRYERITPVEAHNWSQGFADALPVSPTELVQDSKGDLIFAGFFTGKLVFGDGAYDGGDGTLFIAKATKHGKPIWSRLLGIQDKKHISIKIACDSQGHIILAGVYNPLPGSGIEDGTQFYLSKLTPDGETEWAQALEKFELAGANCLAVDLKDEILVGGIATGISETGQVVRDGMAKYTSGGQNVWSLKLSENAELNPEKLPIISIDHMAVDRNNIIILCGTFSAQSAQLNTFCMKFETPDKRMWLQQFNGKGRVLPGGLGMNRKNDIVLCLNFTDNITFSNEDTYSTTDQGQQAICLARLYEENGYARWTRPFGLNTYLNSDYLRVSDERIVFGGYFSKKDAGSGIFTSVCDLNGEIQTIMEFSSKVDEADRLDRITGLTLDEQDNIVISGAYSNLINFGGGDLTGVNPKSPSIFLASLKIRALPFVALAVDTDGSGPSKSMMDWTNNEHTVFELFGKIRRPTGALALSNERITGTIQNNKINGLLLLNADDPMVLDGKLDQLEGAGDIILAGEDGALTLSGNILLKVLCGTPRDFYNTETWMLDGTVEAHTNLIVSENVFLEKGSVLIGNTIGLNGNQFKAGPPEDSKTVALIIADSATATGNTAPSGLLLRRMTLSRFAESANLIEIY